MNITIQILSVLSETKPTQKGSYQQLEIAYKDLSAQGKVSSKKIMSFTDKRVFDMLAVAKPTQVFDIAMVKNDKGYWDWKEVKRSESGSVTSSSTTSAGATQVVGSQQAPARGGWETPDERAKKQVYIIRQSSLSTAVAALQVGRKGVIEPEEVIKYARQLENYVFSTGDLEAVVSQDVGTIETIPEDIPF